MANDTTSLGMKKEKKFKGKKFRIAIIGCGGISQAHLRAYQDIPEVEIVAGCDIKQECLDRMNKEWGVPVKSLYKDWKEMIKKEKLDAVDICTPNGVHCAPAIDACNAGLHVMVEKPMAMNVAECKKMVAAAKKNKVKLAVGFQQRYHDNAEFLIRAREAGKFGEIKFVKVQALRRRGIPNWGVFGQKELQGGGPMIDIGVHMIELAHFIMGQPKPVAISGNVWTYLGNKKAETVCPWPDWDYKTYTVEDLAIGQVRFENGAIMQIESSFAAHIEKDVHNVTFMGTKGGGSFRPAAIYTDQDGTMVNIAPGFLPNPDANWTVLFKNKLQNWINAATKGTPLLADAEEGMVIQKILNGLYDAAEAGKEIEIK